MSRTLWTIIFIGFLTVIFLIMAMMVSLDQFRQSPASNQLRIAEGVREQFKFDSVAASVLTDDGKRALRLAYETHADSKLDLSAQGQEMQAVADYVIAHYDPKDRRLIDEVRIARTEIHGRGCWKSTYMANHTARNPFREVLPPPLRRPGDK